MLCIKTALWTKAVSLQRYFWFWIFSYGRFCSSVVTLKWLTANFWNQIWKAWWKSLMFCLIFLFFSSVDKGLECWRLKSLLSPERNVSKQGITIMNSTVHDTKARTSSVQQAVKDLAVSWQFFKNDNNKRFCRFRHVKSKGYFSTKNDTESF